MSLVVLLFATKGRAQIPHRGRIEELSANLRILFPAQNLLEGVFADDEGVVVENGVVKVFLHDLQKTNSNEIMKKVILLLFENRKIAMFSVRRTVHG